MGILKWEVFLESHGFSYLEVERSVYYISSAAVDYGNVVIVCTIL